MKLPALLPAPSNFAEGQRALFGCLVAAAGMFFGAFAAAIVTILVWGGWPESRYEQIIAILGWGFMIILGIVGVVIVSLALGGPVGRFKGSVSRDGLNVEASGDGEPAPQITATSTVTVQPATPPGGPPPPSGLPGL